MYNKIVLIGYVGRDPETQTFQNGGSITSFSMATSESWKDKNSGEWKEKSIWHRIAVGGATAGYVQRNIKKGDLVIVEGQQDNRKYEHNGETKYISEVRVGYGGSVQKVRAGNSGSGQTYDPGAVYQGEKSDPFDSPSGKVNTQEDLPF